MKYWAEKSEEYWAESLVAMTALYKAVLMVVT